METRHHSKTLLPRAQSDQKRVVEDHSDPSLRKIIRAMGLKVTGPRVLILGVLKSGGRHVTAQELFEQITEVDSSVGFATVYRFLRELTTAGFVTELRMGGTSARYELTGPHHHDHLTCLSCGQIYEFENNQIEILQEQVAAQFGFQLRHHVLELYGVCRTCQKLEAEAKPLVK